MRVKDLLGQSEEILDLTLDGWERTIHFDLSKLAEEVGEVAECLNKSKKTDVDLGEELSDVIAVVGVIALKRNIDLEQAIISKQEKRVEKLLKQLIAKLEKRGFPK